MVEILNTELRDAQFKDESPIKTVEKIQTILNRYGIETEETWRESGVLHCHSLSLKLKGGFFSANGKGMTREFARASAYAEFMERTQLGMIGKAIVQKNGYYNEVIGNNIDIPVEELLNSDTLKNNWYNDLSENLYKHTKIKMTNEEILRQFAENDKVPCLPFYNLMTGKTVYVPSQLRKVVFGTNGAAAGNTIEEAIVQAISEIVERYNKFKILTEEIAVPDIPEDVLCKFEAAYHIITDLRSKGIKVVIKDCSLGEKFPVVCVCYINSYTGRYHVHFGANPILEIALERALTESFQGRNIENFAKWEDLIYENNDVLSYESTYIELRNGDYKKSPGFFVNEPNFEYNYNMGFTSTNNQQLLSELINYFKSIQKEIIVMDASCLGFPTCHVIIPNYSEAIYYNLSQKHSILSHSDAAIKTLRNPEKANLMDAIGLLTHINKIKEEIRRDKALGYFSTNAKLALACDINEEFFLINAALAYVNFELGNYNSISNLVAEMIKFGTSEAVEKLLCLKRFFDLKTNGFSEEETKKTLEFLHNPKTVTSFYETLNNKKNPFDEFIVKCDLQNCENCKMINKCGQKYTIKLVELIKQKSQELNFEDFSNHLEKYATK